MSRYLLLIIALIQMALGITTIALYFNSTQGPINNLIIVVNVFVIVFGLVEIIVLCASGAFVRRNRLEDKNELRSEDDILLDEKKAK